MKILRFTTVLLGLVMSSSVCGGEFSVADVDHAACEQFNGSSMCLTLLYSGIIKTGDDRKLMSEIERLTQGIESIFRDRDPKFSVRIGVIFFDSPGGDLFEAMRLGRLIRSKMIMTQVTHDSSCYSACVIAFLGGVTRLPVGPIGIHSFYSEDFIGSVSFAKASERYNEISSEVEKYLRELRIPVSLLDEMKRVPHYNLKIFDGDFSGELGRYGVFGIDPVYAQVKDKK